MFYPQLFNWWIGSITFNILFVIVASIYLYKRRKTKQLSGQSVAQRIRHVVYDFVFVWFLLGLLIFYVISVGEGSYLLFLEGNIVVEVLLLIFIYSSSSAHKGG